MPMIKIETGGELMIINTDKIDVFSSDHYKDPDTETHNIKFSMGGLQYHISYTKWPDSEVEPSHEEKCVKAIEKAMRERV